MKKKLVTKIMAFLMAILCLVGTMPLTSVKAAEEKTGKEKLSELVDTVDGVMQETVISKNGKGLKLFTFYTDSTTYYTMEEQLKNQKDILSSEHTEAEYQAAYEAFEAECEFFFEEWHVKTPDKEALRELINSTKTYLKNVDESEDFEDVEPGMIWVKPDVLKDLKSSLDEACDTYNTYLDADEQNYDVYTKIYNACVALEASLDKVKEEDGNSKLKPCTLDDVKNLLDSLKKVREDVPYYDTKEQAEAAGVEYYILTADKNKFDEEIAVVEEQISKESEMVEGMCLKTYNYAKRAASKFVKNIVIVDNNKSENVTKEELDEALRISSLATDERYLASVTSKDEARYGEAYALVEYVEAYNEEVKSIREAAAKEGADYSELLDKLQAALNELRSHIEYKETTMEDLNEALYYADVFKSQLKTAASDDDIILNGDKGAQYVLESDMEAFDKSIAWAEKEKENVASESDVILREYYILALVQHVNRAMSDLSEKIKIVDADDIALKSMIDLAEEFVESIYKADSFDKVPEGRYWISPTALNHVNEQIAKAKAALATDNISEKNDAYNALSTAFAKTKAMVKKGAPAVVTPDKDVNTDNNNSSAVTESVDTPQTGDVSGMYAYVLMAALSAALLATAGYRKVRR